MNKKEMKDENARNDFNKKQAILQKIHMINVELHEDIDFKIEELESVKQELFTPKIDARYDLKYPSAFHQLDPVEFKRGIEKFIQKVEMNKLSCDHEELVLEMKEKLATCDALETHLYSFQFILFDQKCISNTCINTRSILAINQAEAITELKQDFPDKCVLDIQLLENAA
jgi:hypothetical protein